MKYGQHKEYDVQVFENESVFYYPNAPSPEVEVPMALKKDAAVTVLIKVYWSVASPITLTSMTVFLHITLMDAVLLF